MDDYEALHAELLHRIERTRRFLEKANPRYPACLHHFDEGEDQTIYVIMTLAIDNADHRLDGMVRRVLDYVDCLTEEAARSEYSMYSTDRFAFVLDGERTEVKVTEVSNGVSFKKFSWHGNKLSPEELADKRAQWQAVRRRLMQASQLEIEHYYYDDRSDLDTFTTDGLVSLLDDMMGDGQLADRVSMRVLATPHDPDHESDGNYDIEYLYRNYLWMNGMLRGEYVHGEVPFVSDDDLMRTIASWRLSFDPREGDEFCGIYLMLSPDTDPALLARAKACVLDFEKKLDCGINYAISPSDFYVPAGTYYRTNEQEVRLWLAQFEKLREAFTLDEVRQMLRCAVPLQDIMVRHAGGKYTPDEIELYRFGCSAYTLIGITESLRSEEAEAKLEWPEQLRRKVADLPEELKLIPKNSDGYELFLIGMGDFSDKEAGNAIDITSTHGLYVGIYDLRLNSLDDIYTAEALFNELADIMYEARAKDQGKPRPRLVWEDYDTVLVSLEEYTWGSFHSGINELYKNLHGEVTGLYHDSRKRYYVTNRDYYAFFQRAGACYEETNTFHGDMITFEAQDPGVRARLRFRLENGKFIHEVAVMD